MARQSLSVLGNYEFWGLVRAAANALRGLASDPRNTDYVFLPTPDTAFTEVVTREVRIRTGSETFRTIRVPVYMTATITRNRTTIMTSEEVDSFILQQDTDHNATRMYLPSIFGGSHDDFNVFTGPIFIWTQYLHEIQSFFHEDDEDDVNRCVTVQYAIYYKPNSDQPETICVWFVGEIKRLFLGEPLEEVAVFVGQNCWNRRHPADIESQFAPQFTIETIRTLWCRVFALYLADIINFQQ